MRNCFFTRKGEITRIAKCHVPFRSIAAAVSQGGLEYLAADCLFELSRAQMREPPAQLATNKEANSLPKCPSQILVPGYNQPGR